MYFYNFNSIYIEKKIDKNYTEIRVADSSKCFHSWNSSITECFNEIYLNLLH